MNKKLTENDLIKRIKKLMPEAKPIKASEFYDDAEVVGIWFKGEYASDDLLIFDYYEEYGYDIHPKLDKIITEAGWVGCPYDAGTLMAFED